MLAPEREPPAGFESRVLARMQPPATAARPHRLRRRLWPAVVSAAVAAAATAAVVLGATSDDRRLADHYRAALGHGARQRLRGGAAPRPRAGPRVVYGYRGSPSWIFVAIYRPYRSTTYTVELAMTSGRRVPLPSLRLDARTGSAGQAIPVDMHDVSGVRLVGTARGDVLEAQLPHAR
jgi:hypothetical protein